MKILMSKKHYIGIDLGGTKLAIGLVNSHAQLLTHKKILLNFNEQNIIKIIADEISALTRIKKNISGIGLASAGPLNTITGTLIHPTNFPNWKKVPIVKLLKSELKKRKLTIPIYFQNDAMAAALGEGWIGAAKKNKNYAVITLGTGVGTGVIFKGEPTQFKGVGGEWGHQLIELSSIQNNPTLDPHQFSIEGFASGTGLLQKAKKMGFNGNSVEHLVKQISAGNTEYKKVFNDMAYALAILCYNLSMGCHLEKIIFGGGLMEIQSYFFPQTKLLYNKLIKRRPGFSATIAAARLKNNAGIIGAAYLVHTA